MFVPYDKKTQVTEVAKVETKKVTKDSLSALLTDEKDSTATKSGKNP